MNHRDNLIPMTVWGRKLLFLHRDSGFYVSAGYMSLMSEIIIGTTYKNVDLCIINPIIYWYFLVSAQLTWHFPEFSLIFYLFREQAVVKYTYFFMFIFERERERETAGEGQREWDRGSQAGSCCQRRAGCGAQTQKLQDHDLSWSQRLNWLSHPRRPRGKSFLAPRESDRSPYSQRIKNKSTPCVYPFGLINPRGCGLSSGRWSP